MPIEMASEGLSRRIGFLKDCFKVPSDFDAMGKDEIESLFVGSS